MFFTWEHGEDFLKKSIETINVFSHHYKFTAEWLKKAKKLGNLKLTYISNQLTLRFSTQHLVTHTDERRVYFQGRNFTGRNLCDSA